MLNSSDKKRIDVVTTPTHIIKNIPQKINLINLTIGVYCIRGVPPCLTLQRKFDEYVERYADSFQHGGVSMAEKILPLVILEAK